MRSQVRFLLAPPVVGPVRVGLGKHSGGTLSTDAGLLFVSLSLSKENECLSHLSMSLFWIGV